MLSTKHHTSRLRPRLFAIIVLLLALGAHVAAQPASTDPDNPTPMVSNVVTGKSNGKAKTVYYSFVATGADPGEIKVKVTANTDERSTNLRVNFLDDDGQKVMDEIYVIPNRDPATKVARHTFADRQKVVMRVTLADDPQVKLLNYRVEVTGAVEFEATPATPTTGDGATPVTDPAAPPPSDPEPVTDPTADAAATPTDAGQTGDASGGETQPSAGKKTVKEKVKEGAKKTVKKTAKDALKDLLKDND